RSRPLPRVVPHTSALVEAGRMQEAIAVASEGHEHALSDRVAIHQIWFGFMVGRSLLLQGQPVSGRRWFHQAATLARATGFDGPRRVALVGMAICAAQV